MSQRKNHRRDTDKFTGPDTRHARIKYLPRGLKIAWDSPDAVHWAKRSRVRRERRCLLLELRFFY